MSHGTRDRLVETFAFSGLPKLKGERESAGRLQRETRYRVCRSRAPSLRGRCVLICSVVNILLYREVSQSWKQVSAQLAFCGWAGDAAPTSSVSLTFPPAPITCF